MKITGGDSGDWIDLNITMFDYDIDMINELSAGKGVNMRLMFKKKDDDYLMGHLALMPLDDKETLTNSMDNSRDFTSVSWKQS